VITQERLDTMSLAEKDALILQQQQTINELLSTVDKLTQKVEELTQEVQTLRRQIFGQKSEKKPQLPAEGQLVLGLQGEGEPEYEANEKDDETVID
jgi:Transposase C of IS166 homeodomain